MREVGKMKTIAHITVASTLLVTACSTHNVQVNDSVAKSGLVYVEAVDILLDQTRETIIDLDSTELWYMRDHQNKKRILAEKSRKTSKQLDELEAFRNSIANTKQYYQALNTLIDDPTRESVALSLSEISMTIAKENQRKSEEAYATVSRKEASISKISEIAVNAHYSKRIRSILIKDAPIIERQLSLQKKQLKHIVSSLHRHIQTSSTIHFKKGLEEPYINSKRLTIDKWKGSRRQWFEMKQAIPAVADLKKAHKAVRKSWALVLNGNRNITPISHMMIDANNFTQAVKGLKSTPNAQTPITIYDVGTSL
jgi:hypothetical protein